MDTQPPNQTPNQPSNQPANPSATACACSSAAAAGNATSAGSVQIPAATNTTTCNAPNVVTIPVPIVQNEEYYAYITVKGSLHDRSCCVFGLNEAETQALSKRYGSGVKEVVNGVMVPVPPMVMVNTLAQLSYKVVCSCGEAEICWTMQREV